MNTVLITGASGKVGRIITKNFLESGDIVIAIARTEKSLLALKDYCQPVSKKLHIIAIDLLNDSSIDFIKKEIISHKLLPNILINNARSIDNLKTDENCYVKPENFVNEFNIGVVVPYVLSNSLVESFPTMRQIINIGSIYGEVAVNPSLYLSEKERSPIHYGVTKAALSHLTKELAVRYANKQIRVNCIAYGGIEGRVDEGFKKRYAKLCPSGSMLSEKDIFGPLQLITSEKSSGINGHTLLVDGGWTIW